MSSILLKTAVKLILPLTLIFAAYTALKGHNNPGGGFVGGLMVAVGINLYRMAESRAALMRLIPFHPRLLVFIGLALATLTAIVPMLFGEPLLRSYVDNVDLGFDQSIHFASAVFFDTGVLLVVVGVSVGMIQRLAEELEAEGGGER